MSTWLGMCGEKATDVAEERESGYWTNKLGGSADWMCEVPSEEERCCPVCGSTMELLIQLYAPLESSIYHRTLYILACVGVCKAKPSSWRALRSQCVDELSSTESVAVHSESKAIDCEPQAAVDDWGVDQDDWGVPDGGTGGFDIGPSVIPMAASSSATSRVAASTVCTRAVTSASATPKAQLCGNSCRSENRFACYYIDVAEEAAAGVSTGAFSHELQLLAQYEKAEGVSLKSIIGDGSAAAAASSGEQYEKEKAKHGDRAFEKFQKVLARTPTQCLRYRWPLTPLEFSDAQPLPQELRCRHCGANARPEVQLMPPLLVHLAPRPGAAAAATAASGAVSCAGGGVDFGTVVVFTCSESCWMDGCTPRTELCFVLQDPDQEKLDTFAMRTVESQSSS